MKPKEPPRPYQWMMVPDQSGIFMFEGNPIWGTDKNWMLPQLIKDCNDAYAAGWRAREEAGE